MYIDPNNEYSFVLQWIKESADMMTPILRMAKRKMRAYHDFLPSKNVYKAQADKLTPEYARKVGVSDMDYNRIKCAVETIPEGRSDIFWKTVETNVNQLSGGIGQYQTTIMDKAQILDDDLEELLSLNSEMVYNQYLDSIRDVSLREIQLYGATYYYPSYDTKTGDISVELISLDKIILDPIRFRRNGARYIGFHKMLSWAELEKEVEFKGKFLKVKNDVKIYAKKIQDLMNNVYIDSDPTARVELQTDIDNIYVGSKYQSEATDPNSKSKLKYQGEDVEVSYVWDLSDGTRYTVVNRRYVVNVEKDTLKAVSYIENELSRETVRSEVSTRIKSPIIEIPFKQEPNRAFPTTPLDLYLDDFDELCALDSLRKHNYSIAGTITPFGGAEDLAILANAGNVSGVSVYGIEGQIGYLAKNYDPTLIENFIRSKEQAIKEGMNAYSQMDQATMIGDRATAREAGQVANMVSAGHNALIHNIEHGFAEVLRVINLLIVRYDNKRTIKLNYNDEIITLPVEKLALNAVLNVKLKSEVEQERQRNSLQASQMLNLGVNNPYINQEEFMPFILKQSFGGIMTKRQAKMMVKTPEDETGKQLALQEAQNYAQQLQLEQQAIEQDPEGAIAHRMNAQMTPEDRELFIRQQIMDNYNETGELPPEILEELRNQQNGQSAMPVEQDNEYSDTLNQEKMLDEVNGEVVPATKGLAPEQAGLIANGSEVM